MLASPIHRSRKVSTSAARLANRRRFMQATNMQPSPIDHLNVPTRVFEPNESFHNFVDASMAASDHVPVPTRVFEPNESFYNFVDASMAASDDWPSPHTPRSLYSLDIEEVQAMLASFTGCNAYYDLTRKHYMKAISRKHKSDALPLDDAHRFIDQHFDTSDIYKYIDTHCAFMS